MRLKRPPITTGPWTAVQQTPAYIVDAQDNLIFRALAHTSMPVEEYRANTEAAAALPEVMDFLEKFYKGEQEAYEKGDATRFGPWQEAHALMLKMGYEEDKGGE